MVPKPALETRGSSAHYPGKQALPGRPEVHVDMPSREGLEITGAAWERRPQPGSTNKTRQCHGAGVAKPGAREGWAGGGRASLPPKSMSLLTWAEENLTALETCPSDEKEEAEKRLEPEKAQRCRRDQLPIGDLVASPLCSAFTKAQEDRCCCQSHHHLPSCLTTCLPLR